MNLTNHLALPQAFIDAVINDDYDLGEAAISVTGLISPPQASLLRRAHDASISEDAADRVFSLLGQCMHTVLERANRLDMAEKRFYAEYLGWRVSGKGDTVLLDDNTLVDYKLTTVWKFLGGKIPPEFEQQLNLYRVLLHDNGITINSLKILGALRDWSKPEARRNKDYPQKQVVYLDVPMWPLEAARAFMEARVALHQKAQQAFDLGDPLPPCSDEERWIKPSLWACKKAGSLRATKVFRNEGEARAFASSKNLEVEFRPGEATRCLLYCSASPFCEQWKNDPENPEKALEGIFP